jgi:hypothetical protein
LENGKEKRAFISARESSGASDAGADDRRQGDQGEEERHDMFHDQNCQSLSMAI